MKLHKFIPGKYAFPGLLLVLWLANTPLSAQTPTLSSIMQPFRKQPKCEGATWMGVELNILIQAPSTINYSNGRGRTIDLCLARVSSEIRGRSASIPYYQFEGTGNLDFSSGPDATFVLKLGQPVTSIASQPQPLGTLKITYANGTIKELTLPAILQISQNGRFIHGEVDNTNAAIAILIQSCTSEGC